ncbi:MAG: hypothetical protein R3293_27495, partial [Candidatus Promineifilaceae bacterium]|nr:hypothetical protein [Candidatus Promineifilaceae bacterium]
MLKKYIAGRGANVLIIAIGLILIGLYIVTLLLTTSGRPISPLDDAYIHFQYAKQIAEGEPWRYNSGDPLSTGATSLLYPFLLAIGYTAGFHADQIVWIALLIGGFSLILSALLIYWITLQLVEHNELDEVSWMRLTAFTAALLFLLNGAIQWTYLNGMESGLFTLFLLATFYMGLKEQLWPLALFLILSSLLRPEGF